MPEQDAFDPTHALDGWRPPAPAPLQALDLDALLHPRPPEAKRLLVNEAAGGQDPTHLLDGWRPPAPTPLDLDLKSMLRAGSAPDEAKMARLKARGYEMLDVEDVELVEAPPPRVVAVEAWVEELPPAPPPAEAKPAEVDLALPDEPPWPLFMEEAQILDGGAAPAEPVVAETSGPELQVEPAASIEMEPESPSLAAMADAPVEAPPVELQPAAVAEEVPVMEEAETPVLDFRASPPEPPSGVGDIQLPPMASPPAAEAPVLDFHVAPPPPEPDPEAVIAGIELPQVASPPAVVEMPELDIAAVNPQPPPEPDPRLLAHWQVGAWTALARQVAGSSEELLQTSNGLRVESHAPQWLCAIWPPRLADAPLGRWPELASLVAAETTADALQQLLGELPEEAGLWSADLEADWDLVAELVLHQDAGLRPAQARALREFAQAERSASLARLGTGYALQGRVARRRA